MTENSDPYENALAERMNRTLKEEFSLDRTFFSYEQAKQLAAEAIAYIIRLGLMPAAII